MNVLALGACVNLIAFATIATVLGLVLRPAARRLLAGAPRSSRTLGALRLAPSLVAAGFVAFLLLPAFVWLEPRDTGERVTPALLAPALLAAALTAVGLLRGLRALAATWSLLGVWRGRAVPRAIPGVPVPVLVVDDPFPVVAVAGILRPRLCVARQVLGALGRDELAAVLAHEAAHLRRRDNLKRLLLVACPDPLAWGTLGVEMERAWNAAAEREADAAVETAARRVDLASALVKVARLAEGRAPILGAAAAFYRGDGIADRVERLLLPVPAAAAPSSVRRLALLAATAATPVLVLIQPALLRGVHALTERFVHLTQ